ncbi:hypothetical protein ACFXTH_037814 [Malus domestica]
MGAIGKWYFTKEEIETETPSQMHGISRMKESELRRYCLFLRELGTKLKVGRVTISTAMMLCHQFYMRQSHGKNDWKIVATSSMLLACKLVKEVRELILLGDRLVLQTIGFEFDRIKHPYDPLASALRRLNCSSYRGLGMLAISLIKECLQTILCLEFKPQCIAAGSVAIAAEFLKVPTPSTRLLQMNGKFWWHETLSRNPSASCSSSQSCVSIKETVDLQPTKKQRTSL